MNRTIWPEFSSCLRRAMRSFALNGVAESNLKNSVLHPSMSGHSQPEKSSAPHEESESRGGDDSVRRAYGTRGDVIASRGLANCFGEAAGSALVVIRSRRACLPQ